MHDKITYLLAMDLARAIKFNDEHTNMTSTYTFLLNDVMHSGLDSVRVVAVLEAVKGDRSSITFSVAIVH